MSRLFGDERPDEDAPAVTLVDWDPDGEDKLLAAICYAVVDRCRSARSLDRVRRLSADERVALLRAYVGERSEPPPQARAGLRAHRTTASTCCPTTAPSGTSSATGC